MASTITATNLVITVKEEITINGKDLGNENRLTISSITEVTRRIVNCPTSEVVLIAFGTAVAAGQYVESEVRYIRITNKDDTNHAGLIFRNEDSDEFSVKLDAGQSFIYNADLSGGVVDTMDAAATAVTPNTFADLVDITGIADTAAVDLEIFVASA
jgi:hypothetical protein